MTIWFSKTEQELVSLTKIKPDPEEDRQFYLLRLSREANKIITSADWENLSESAQLWLNAATWAREQHYKHDIKASRGICQGMPLYRQILNIEFHDFVAKEGN
jgi:hypothetical protein